MKKWNDFSDTSSTAAEKKGSRMMMMDLIAGSFDILVRRVHKKEATEEGEHKKRSVIRKFRSAADFFCPLGSRKIFPHLRS
jgi:hypothetical protein